LQLPLTIEVAGRYEVDATISAGVAFWDNIYLAIFNEQQQVSVEFLAPRNATRAPWLIAASLWLGANATIDIRARASMMDNVVGVWLAAIGIRRVL